MGEKIKIHKRWVKKVENKKKGEKTTLWMTKKKDFKKMEEKCEVKKMDEKCEFKKRWLQKNDIQNRKKEK